MDGRWPLPVRVSSEQTGVCSSVTHTRTTLAAGRRQRATDRKRRRRCQADNGSVDAPVRRRCTKEETRLRKNVNKLNVVKFALYAAPISCIITSSQSNRAASDFYSGVWLSPSQSSGGKKSIHRKLIQLQNPFSTFKESSAGLLTSPVSFKGHRNVFLKCIWINRNHPELVGTLSGTTTSSGKTSDVTWALIGSGNCQSRRSGSKFKLC